MLKVSLWHTSSEKTGPSPSLENSPDYIDKAISLGFDVEVDVRLVEGEIWLGHDQPQYKVDLQFLLDRLNNLW
jgi:hypothetical protein